MLQIVVYLRGVSTGNSGSMANASRACAARSACSTAGDASRAREDESEIAGAFGQRHEQLIRLRGDPDVVDVRHVARRRRRRRRARKMPRRGIGIIITPDASLSPAPVVGRFAERVAQEQLLERDGDSGFGIRSDPSPRPTARSAARARTGRRSAARRLRARTRPRSFTRHSAWIGPWCRPIAAAARGDGVDDRAPGRLPAPTRA